MCRSSSNFVKKILEKSIFCTLENNVVMIPDGVFSTFAHLVTILLMETSWWYSTRIHHYYLLIIFLFFNLLVYFVNKFISTISLRLCFHHFCIFRYLHAIYPKAKNKWNCSNNLDWKIARQVYGESLN